MQLIDFKKDEFDINLKDFTRYWSILTTKGRALYYLKDYKKSIPIFDRLLQWDSESDNFKNWLEASKSRNRNSINIYLYLIASILMITKIFFGGKIGNPKVKLYLAGFGFIIFSIALINEYLVDEIIKRIKKQ